MQSSANVIQMYVSMFISRAVLNTFFFVVRLNWKSNFQQEPWESHLNSQGTLNY